jgi:hypothetical protein
MVCPKYRKHIFEKRKEKKGKQKMKRIVKIEKCRKCKSQKWQKRDTYISISIIDENNNYKFDDMVTIKTVYVCSVCETKTYTDPLSETYEPQLTIEERDGNK